MHNSSGLTSTEKQYKSSQHYTDAKFTAIKAAEATATVHFTLQSTSTDKN